MVTVGVVVVAVLVGLGLALFVVVGLTLADGEAVGVAADTGKTHQITRPSRNPRSMSLVEMGEVFIDIILWFQSRSGSGFKFGSWTR